MVKTKQNQKHAKGISKTERFFNIENCSNMFYSYVFCLQKAEPPPPPGRFFFAHISCCLQEKAEVSFRKNQFPDWTDLILEPTRPDTSCSEGPRTQTHLLEYLFFVLKRVSTGKKAFNHILNSFPGEKIL